jgi:hypothetical protein
LTKGIVVPDIGHDGIAGPELVQVDQFHDPVFEQIQVFFLTGGNKNGIRMFFF